jgi:hypothetical protein
LAASAAHMRYGAKKDENHVAIQEAIEAFGIPVYDMSGAGSGVPDCLVWIRESWQLVEIKNPKTAYGRRGLNAIQKVWIDKWRGGPVHILKSVDDALAFVKGDLSKIDVIHGR